MKVLVTGELESVFLVEGILIKKVFVRGIINKVGLEVELLF